MDKKITVKKFEIGSETFEEDVQDYYDFVFEKQRDNPSSYSHAENIVIANYLVIFLYEYNRTAE